jgi:uncharacterized membrane protein SirB2
MYLLLKIVHIACAIASICGFLLRGYWMMTSSDLLRRKLTRITPHVIDTLFLLSGIAMLYVLSLNPFTQGWLVAKFAGLIVYILLGTIAIKRGPTLQIRMAAFVGAVSVFAYIAGVALSRSAASWLAYLTL